jgi:2-polyprenyl-6-methoxyphenol hydroxylase-like FAD-dependent oxidoreductase
MDADVIVIGAGPSGLTLASEVALSGAKVLVLEKRVGVVESRAGTLVPRVLELFDARGVADRLIVKAGQVQRWPFSGGHIWAGLKPVEWRHIDSRFGITLVCPQNLTEEVLVEVVRERHAEVRFGHEVQTLSETDNGVAVEVLAGGTQRRLSARYLIGADGPRSTVRKALRLPFEGTAPTFTGIIADFELPFPFGSGMKSVDNEFGWGLALPFGKNATRITMVHAERRYAPKDEPVTIEEYTRCLRDIFGTDFGIKKLKWSSRYSDQLRIIPSFRHGRIFMIGESARIHYPASGVGMNFCIQDSFNLGWKLGYVLRGDADPRILDTYDSERRPVALELLRSVRAQIAMQFNFTPDGIAQKREFENRLLPLAEVNRKIGLELNGVEHPYPCAPGAHPLTGFRVPDLDLLLLNGRVTRIGELLRDQKFLLLDLSGTAAFAALEIGDAPVNVIEAFAGRRAPEHVKIKALLIRPDAYVAWATDTAPTASLAWKALSAWLKFPVEEMA